MGIGSIVNLASGYVQSLLSGPSNDGGHSSLDGSSFGQILSSLQQLQHSNPSQYSKVTQQISGNLQTAAQSATATGNTRLAAEENRLSADFRKASVNGQLPNFQDLARASGLSAPSRPLSIIENTLSSAGIQIR